MYTAGLRNRWILWEPVLDVFAGRAGRAT
jgi:hypothetical protein